jgi:hypothetical protein
MWKDGNAGPERRRVDVSPRHRIKISDGQRGHSPPADAALVLTLHDCTQPDSVLSVRRLVQARPHRSPRRLRPPRVRPPRQSFPHEQLLITPPLATAVAPPSRDQQPIRWNGSVSQFRAGGVTDGFGFGTKPALSRPCRTVTGSYGFM